MVTEDFPMEKSVQAFKNIVIFCFKKALCFRCKNEVY